MAASTFPTDQKITLSLASDPSGDVIFLPSDSRGTPGELNSWALGQLGLPKRTLPTARQLRIGYAFKSSGKRKICFVVTVDDKDDTSQSLRKNLQSALLSTEMTDARVAWIPLMGTGAGGLKLDESFDIILSTIQSSRWFAIPETRVVFSFPEDGTRLLDQKRDLISGYNSTGSASADQQSGYELARTAAVSEVLALAASLAPFRREPAERISTTLLFSALVQSQSAVALDSFKLDSLKGDLSAELFAGAVLHLASNRYDVAQQTYFSSSADLTGPLVQRELPLPTTHVSEILVQALQLARRNGKLQIGIDHLVEALLTLKEARLHRTLDQMNVGAGQLLREFRDARLGQVATTLHNDVASMEDRLGYDTYADAIAEFLVHADTPPPLSISIQAPWGGGKSSLMNLIRENLDPTRERDANKPKPGPFPESRLRLQNVLTLIDEQGQFSPFASSGSKLWTVWFNAWKYENSEQVWAGLVDAIVSQIAERLPLIEREKFLLKLQLARIDDRIVREKIYDRVIAIWWSKTRAWALAGCATIASLLGLKLAEPALPDQIKEAVALWSGTSAIAVQIILSIYLIGTYLISRSKTHKEPAAFSLSEYIQIPDYNKSTGQIYQIHADLRRVLSVVPRDPGGTVNSPIVIFIDDLDRCSPTKVANVVEGVSMLLASETYRCMFVIGMDPQMIAAALEKAHEDVRKQLPRYERTVPLGWRFMDKFIQLPFTIPPSPPALLSSYVKWLGGSDDTPPPQVSDLRPESAEILASNSNEEVPHVANDVKRVTESVGPSEASNSTDFVETRDVGQIIRKVVKYNTGNPREVKRMVNLARLYLSLRNARRRKFENWRSPDLDQYARWIALSLRWPDMMRWLQWGADEASWPSEYRVTDLVVKRLRVLEEEAEGAQFAKDWQESLSKRLLVPIKSETDWACDPMLFDFFKEEAHLNQPKRLSAAAERNFC